MLDQKRRTRGVPAAANLRRDFMVEMQRLHRIYLDGRWDPMTTKTTITWILRRRRDVQEMGATATATAHMAEEKKASVRKLFPCGRASSPVLRQPLAGGGLEAGWRVKTSRFEEVSS